MGDSVKLHIDGKEIGTAPGQTIFKAAKIILFGSLAEGKVNPYSDIDLVIIKDTRKRFLQRLKEVGLLCKARIGVDYLVYTPRSSEKWGRRIPSSRMKL